MKIADLTKEELANYLFVRDIIKSEAEINNYMSVNDILLLILPFILVIIFILIGILFYKNNETEKIIYDKDRIE